eukprot:g3467.t1
MRIARSLRQFVFQIVSELQQECRGLLFARTNTTVIKLEVETQALQISTEDCQQKWSEVALEKAKLADLKTRDFQSLERFSKHADTQFLRTFEALRSLGLSDKEVGQAFRLYPRIVARSLEKIPERVQDLQELLNVNLHDIRRTVCLYPVVLFKTREQIRNLRDSLIVSGFDKKQVKKIFCKYPVIIGLNMDRKLAELHELLVKQYCVTEDDYIKMLTYQSRIIGLSLSNIVEKLKYVESLGLTREQVGKMLRRGAAIFGFNIDTGYKRRVAWLESIGVEGNNLTMLISREPLALIYSLSKLERGYSQLKNWKLTDEDIVKIYTSCSRILGLNLDSPLQTAKAEFINKTLRFDLADVLRRNPTVFYASLTRRYLVRYDYLLSIGKSEFKLRTFLVTDQAFCREYTKTSLDHYIQFYNEWQNTKGNTVLRELEKQTEEYESP